jgi:hypothetical protein
VQFNPSFHIQNKNSLSGTQVLHSPFPYKLSFSI